jgi:hypothetical protein
MHENQRTRQYKHQSAAYAKLILNKIRRLDMACKTCGGKGNSRMMAQQNKPVSVPASANVNALPGEMDGRVLTQYVGGKGKGKHYTQGHTTKFSYKVTHGEYVYVDPRDARESNEPQNSRQFVRIHPVIHPAPIPEQPLVIQHPAPIPEQPLVKQDVAKTVERAPRNPVGVQRMPVGHNLPDIGNMSVGDIQALEIDPLVATKLLDIETRGKNRSKAKAFLQARAQSQ